MPAAAVLRTGHAGKIWIHMGRRLIELSQQRETAAGILHSEDSDLHQPG